MFARNFVPESQNSAAGPVQEQHTSKCCKQFQDWRIFGGSVKDQLEALVAQMYSSGILYSEAVREFKKRFIVNVLQQNRGNQCKAARELGMHRNTLSRTIAELDLDVRQLRDGGRRPVRSEKPPVLDSKKIAR
jgi:DNA-binding protein Fis